MKILYDFPTAVGLVGPVRCGKTDEETRKKSCQAIRHAVKYKRVVEPQQHGKALLFTDEQIEVLRRHFAVGASRQSVEAARPKEGESGTRTP